MVKILISGMFGHMGRNVYDLAKEDPDIECAGGVDLREGDVDGVPVHAGFDGVKEKADIVIDFSSAANLDNVLHYAKKTGAGVVLATTGYTPAQIEEITQAAKHTAVFRTANLSIGINLLQKLVAEAAAFLGDAFDAEIIEKHHNLKKDAPSGTALMLADSINQACGNQKEYVYGREGIVGARKKQELGIHAVRGGTIVGEHEVMFAGEDEIITISHSARSKRVFAAGALRAAKFLKGKPAGLYDMKDVLSES